VMKAECLGEYSVADSEVFYRNGTGYKMIYLCAYSLYCLDPILPGGYHKRNSSLSCKRSRQLQISELLQFVVYLLQGYTSA
jgi:hypothetical protein